MKQYHNERRQRTRRLTLSAMLTALGVLILYLGALLDVGSLAAAGIASLFMLLAVRECRGAYPYFIFAATTLLAFLLLPQKEGALLYLLFGGFYPIVKFPIERLRRPLPFIIKLLYVNLIITLTELAAVYLFYLPTLPWGYYVALYLLANPTFFLYDRLIDRILVLYEAKWRPRIARLLP